MGSSPLFRAQALKYATVRQYGSIVLLRPPILSWLTAALCFAALAIVLFFLLASYTRKEQVSGVLAPRGGPERIEAPQAGVVRLVRVREGQDVQAGDELLEVAIGASAPAADSAGQHATPGDARMLIVVRAPVAGTVSGVLVKPGQAIGAAEALAKLSPQGVPLEAELYATSQAAGFAHVGMPVQIRYRAFPFQKFGQFRGEITDIARSPLHSEAALDDSRHATEPLYRIRVKLPRQEVSVQGKSQPLLEGMTIDASLMLETRKLYEWVLEPLSGLAGNT